MLHMQVNKTLFIDPSKTLESTMRALYVIKQVWELYVIKQVQEVKWAVG